VKKMTLEEKVGLTYGSGTSANGCSGEIKPIERLGFPGFCMQDAGNGVRATDFVSGYPSGIHVGASWNKELSHQRGYAMGGEFRAKGVNVMLGTLTHLSLTDFV
jgi:beta-glucosidase